MSKRESFPHREKKRVREDAEFDEEERDEEEPEGEDLFGDDFMDDYLNPDAEEEDEQNLHDENDSIEDEGFIVSDAEVEDEHDGDVAKVDRLIERRHNLERRLAGERLRERPDDPRGQQQQQRDENDEFGSSISDEYGDDSYSREPDRENNEGEEGTGEATSRANLPPAGVPHLEGGAIPLTEDERTYNQGEMLNVDFDWTKPQGELAEWLMMDAPRRVVKNRLYNFLFCFTKDDEGETSGEEGTRVYQERVHVMARDNAQSFEVSYLHLGEVYGSVLAMWLADVPDLMLELLDEAANFLVYNTLYPHYSKVHTQIFTRISEMPMCDPIREFRQVHMNVLVKVEGVVIRRSPIYPQLQAVKYDCSKCRFVIGPIMQRGDKETKVTQCPSCHGKGPFRINMALTQYRNHQTIVLQEPPGKVPPGRLPRSLEVILTRDLIDGAKPGEEIDVTGVYKNSFDPLLNSRQGFPVFTTILHANNFSRRTTEISHFRLPVDEKMKLQALARHPNLKRKLLQSVAPSIHGRDEIKLGLLLSLMGGVPKDVGGDQTHRIRGDINVLLVGDPGCAKSQFLKFVEKTADRAVFTTGRGSTAVGLTASVHKDAVTGDFTLEGGALVVADRGVCLIDEFDKMSDQDRTSIHEAMEQQTISIAKGGIVTTLSARCAIIAAANPIGGRYDPSSSFDANVNLTTPILSRFDLLFVVRDEVNPELDLQLANFICGSHTKNHPKSHEEARIKEREANERLARLHDRYQTEQMTDDERLLLESEIISARNELSGDPNLREDEDPNSSNPLPQSLLRKYLLFAKSHCTPRIANIDENTIARLYTELRQESKHGGLPITVRHMESIIRLSEAHARLHLREFVRDEDVSSAVALFLRCFLQTQKYSMRHQMENKFKKYLETDLEPLQLLQNKLKGLVQTTRSFERQISGGIEPVTVSVDCAELDTVAAGINISKEALANYYSSPIFRKEFELVSDPSTGAYLKILHKKL